MGYTHYWRRTEGYRSEGRQYANAIKTAGKIVTASKILAGWNGEGKPEVGAEGIAFNGIGDAAGHETFELPGSVHALTAFEFCKTARKPYDVVVTAVLATVAHLAPGAITVSSDGNPAEWADGIALAREVTGLNDIETPCGVEEDE